MPGGGYTGGKGFLPEASPKGKGGGGIDIGKDLSNWFGDVEQWGTDAAHRALQFGKATGGVVERNFIDHRGLSNFTRDIGGGLNTGADIINGIGAYAGLPNWMTGEHGDQITWRSSLDNINNRLAQSTIDGVKSMFSDSASPQHPSGPGYWKDVTTVGGVGGKGGGGGSQTNRVWISTATNPGSPDLWHQATHAALSAVNAAFDTPQHMYRAAVLAYRQHGWDGVAAILAPAAAGAAAGALVGNPEVGVATGEAGIAGGAAAGDVAGATVDAAATDAAVTDAGAQTVAQVAEAGGRRAIPSVAEDAQMGSVRRGTQALLDSPLGKASKLVGSPIKSVNNALTSPVLAGAQVPDQAYYFSDGPMGQIWHEAQHPTKDLSTIGRGLSQALLGKQDTWLSGTTDGIAALVAAPYEFGRAIHAPESMGRILTATDSTAVDTAFHKSGGYRNALNQVVKMADGTMGKDVQENLAGAITRAMPVLEPVSKDIADAAHAEVARAAKAGTQPSLYNISKRIGELADQGKMVQTNMLPTIGLYGAFKMANKLSDNYIPSTVSRVLGQAPMALDQGRVTTGTIRLGEANAGYKLGQLLQQTGMKSGDVTRLINHLVSTKDLTQWEHLTKNALKENFFNIIDQRMMKALGFDSEEWRTAFGSGLLSKDQAQQVDAALNQRGFQSTYTAMRESIHKSVEDLVGNSSAGGEEGLFVLDGAGANVSKIGHIDGARAAAVTENQRGELNLPDYHKFSMELDSLLASMRDINSGTANFADTVGGAALRTNHGIDLWVNDRFFKPLALLTPGWALRVSLSELALNVTRLGPGNLAAGAVTRSMLKSQTKAFAIAKRAAKEHISNLESRAVEVRREIAHLDSEGIDSGIKQKELSALQYHIDHLNSPVGTPEPTVGESAGLTAPGQFGSPQAVTQYLKDRGYHLTEVEANNLHMIARGIYIGAKQSILYGMGKDEFINAASYLMYRHGGYLPPALDSIHKSMLSNVDMSGEYVQVDKASEPARDPLTGKTIEKPKTYKVGSRRGEIKTKMVLMSPHDFGTSMFGGKGYFEGWHYGANTLAQSRYYGRPMADAYLGLVQSGMRGEELHNAAVLAAEKIIMESPQSVRDTMARSVVPSEEDLGQDPIHSWATTLVDKVEGIASPKRNLFPRTKAEREAGTRSQEFTYFPHTKLLKDIARGDVGDHTNEFYSRYVFGEDGSPIDRSMYPDTVISRSPQFKQKRDMISHLSTVGHQKFLGPMVNYLSRQPTFIADFALERKRLEKSVAAGTLTADQADVVAETTATRRMSRFIHNPEDKTKFEESMSTVAPFYFAQNQAWRRMGRLFAENPGAFMQYAALMMGVQQLVSDATNQNGMAIKTIPALAMYGMPFAASLSSLSTMDPFSASEDMASASGKSQTILDWIEPKFGPVVTVPTKLLYWRNPNLSKGGAGAFAERQLAGQIGTQETTAQFLYQSAIPNSLIRNLIEPIAGNVMGAAGVRGTAANFLDNAYLQAEIESARYLVSSESEKYWNSLQKDKSLSKLARAEKFYAWQAQRWSSNTAEGQRTTQALLDEARRRANLTWLAKIGLGFGSPVSISVGQADAPMIQKLNNYVKDKKYHGNYMKAVDAFTKDNPWANIDTIAKSKSVYGGYYPATKTMFTWLEKNQDLAKEHPLAAMALAPDLTKDTQYYQPANTLLLNLGLRARQSPQDFVDSWLISSGNSFYYNWIKPAYDKMRNDNSISHSDAYKWKNDMMNWYGQNYNNTWLSNYNASQGTTRKVQAIAQFTKIAATMPNDPVIKNLMDLRDQIMGTGGKLGEYQQFQAAIRSGKTTAVDAQNRWQAWMDEWIKYDPRLKQGIYTLFYNLG